MAEFEYEGGARHRIKDGIDLEKLRETGTCTFELQDVEEALDDDIEENKKDMMEDKSSFFKDISLKNLPVMHCSAEEALADFDEIQGVWTSIHDGVQKKIYRPGRGLPLQQGTKVWIHYMAYHEFSDEPFDCTVHVRRPCSFRMGEGRVIPGLEVAVASMEVKEISKFLIQPHLAYGKLGCEPRVPANSRVLFTVELLEFKAVALCSEVFEMTPEERAKLPFSEILKAAGELKHDAKTEWENKDYQEAVSMYSKAAKMLEEYFITTEEEESEKDTMLFALFNNLALCYLALDKYKKAINASKSAVKIPIDVKKNKSYFCWCKALYKMGNLEEAKKMGDEALRISPNNNEILSLYVEIQKELQKQASVQKLLYKKMMTK